MGRISRKCLGGGYFHIMEQGLNREFIFRNPEDKMKFLQLFFNYKNGTDIRLYAYCVMDNHVHILIRCDDIENLSKVLHKVNSKYANYYNTTYNRVGYVFRDRYRAEPIFNEYHLLNCIKYIHNNPIDANMITDLKNYAYSSYNDYMNDLMPEEIVLELFGKDPDYKKRISGKYEDYSFIEVDNEFGKTEYEDFNKVCKEFEGINFKDAFNVKIVSNQLRKRCGVNHSKIIKFMKISRTTYFEKIKADF